jgi:hypothetical protein
MKKLLPFGIIAGFMPVFVFAADDVQGVLEIIGDFINNLIPFLLALGFLYFVWQMINLLLAKDDDAKKAAKDKVLIAVGIFAGILCLWGLVGILANTFDLDQGQNITDDEIPDFEIDFE